MEALLCAHDYHVALFASGEAFLASDLLEHCLCALIDLRMPGLDGIGLLNKLNARGSRLSVVMITGDGDVAAAVAAMKAGAIDFIEKPYRSSDILEVIGRAERLAQSEDKGEKANIEINARVGALTPRERDLLNHLVLGHSNKIIAFELQISPRTVEIHRANLMKKMAASTLSHLVRMAISVGISSGRP